MESPSLVRKRSAWAGAHAHFTLGSLPAVTIIPAISASVSLGGIKKSSAAGVQVLHVDFPSSRNVVPIALLVRSPMAGRPVDDAIVLLRLCDRGEKHGYQQTESDQQEISIISHLSSFAWRSRAAIGTTSMAALPAVS